MPISALAASILATLAPLAQAGFPAPAVPSYGEQGSSHLGLHFGLGFGDGGVRLAGGGEYGYFVVDGVAPGVEVSVSGGARVLTTAYALANVRLVPFRTAGTLLYVVPRGGRVFLSDHVDLWGVGGSAGLLQFLGGPVGIDVGYDYLRLLPDGDCADLVNGCAIQGLRAGLVVRF
jgi:hypothetical protein